MAFRFATATVDGTPVILVSAIDDARQFTPAVGADDIAAPRLVQRVRQNNVVLSICIAETECDASTMNWTKLP
jgi:hypothetical protein